MTEVAAVVVTYHPSNDVLANIAAVQSQVASVVVVDNEASAASRAVLGPLLGRPGVEVLFNCENRGIAAALNQGVAHAIAKGARWVATFDQDSRVPANYIAGLLTAHARWPEKERVAIVAPLFRDPVLGVRSSLGPLAATPAADATVSVTATSGNLVSVAAFRAVGGVREDFFIDCVDFEFCLRCRRAGWLVLEARSVVLDHQQGRWERRPFLWRQPKVNDYDAVRRYYQSRNRLVLYANLGRFDPAWTIADAYGFGWDFLKLCLLCKGRGAKLRATLAGVADALRGRMGPKPG